MKHVLSGGIALLLLAGCATTSDQRAPATASRTAVPAPSAEAVAAETRRLNEWFEARYDEQLRFSPITMTFEGRRELYDQLDDFSIEAEDRQLAWQKASVEQMESTFNYALLDAEAQRSWDVWKYQYEIAKAGRPFTLNNYVFDRCVGSRHRCRRS